MKKYIIGLSEMNFQDGSFVIVEADNDDFALQKYKDWFVLNDDWFLNTVVYSMGDGSLFYSYLYGDFSYIEDEEEFNNELKKYENLADKKIASMAYRYFENKEWGRLYAKFLTDKEYLNKPIAEIRKKHNFSKEMLLFIFDIVYSNDWVRISQFLLEDFLIERAEAIL